MSRTPDSRDSSYETPLGKLVIVNDGPFWVQEFEQMRSCLFDASQGFIHRIDHIGSTSVPGLVARPIVDLLAGVRSAEDMDRVDSLIIGLNYLPIAPPVADSSVRVYRRPRHGEVTHVVYLAKRDTPFFDSALRLRDSLRLSPVRRSSYSDFKRMSAETFAFDALAYAEAKAVWMRALLRIPDLL